MAIIHITVCSDEETLTLVMTDTAKEVSYDIIIGN